MKYLVTLVSVLIVGCGAPQQDSQNQTPAPETVVPVAHTVVADVTPTPTATATPVVTATPTDAPTSTPVPTDTPTVAPDCVLSSAGSVTSAYNQYLGVYGVYAGQNIPITIQGTLVCTDGNPDLFTLFASEIQTYCVDSVWAKGHCTLTMQAVTTNNGVVSVSVSTNNYATTYGYVPAITTEEIPSQYYQ